MHDPLLALAADLGGAPVELKETHISRVALSGEPGAGVVLKQCKPIDFGFVDLSTPAKRRAALEKEHAVNDRFAPGVYRGVREVSDGEPVLEMLRLNEADTLEAKVKSGEATEADLDAVLDHLLPLFAASERTPEWGDPAVIRRNLTENLDVLAEAERRFGVSAWAGLLRSDQLTHLLDCDALLRARATDGFVRDGHGDLRAEHVYFTTDGVKVLDGIAFCDRLRCVDVADELCFLASDLVRLHPAYDTGSAADGWTLVAELLRRYRERTGDGIAEELSDLYLGYRFAVRAKVAALRAGGDGGDRPVLLREAADRANDAATIYETRDWGWPRWVLGAFGGLSGSGKSTLAAAVAERIGATHWRSDVLRKQMRNVPEGEAAPADAYGKDVSDAVYAALAGVFEIGGTYNAVVDATFLTEARRRAFLDRTLETFGGPTLFVWCECDDAVAEARIVRRTAEGTDASDATVEVRRRQAVGLEGVTEEEFAAFPQAALLRLDTDAPVEELCERVIEALRRMATETGARVAGACDVQ